MNFTYIQIIYYSGDDVLDISADNMPCYVGCLSIFGNLEDFVNKTLNASLYGTTVDVHHLGNMWFLERNDPNIGGDILKVKMVCWT